MSAADAPVLLEVRDHVAHVTLNRPHRLNAISEDLRVALLDVVDRVGRDTDVRVVVLGGTGHRAFCVGADLKDMRRADDDGGLPPPTPMTGVQRNIFEAVLEIPKPTIAALRGYVLAGGLELALACDMRVAGRSATFGLPEARIGMGANFASVLLPRLIPRHLAFELMCSGARFTAERAADVGLLNALVDDDAVTTHVEEMAAVMAANAPLTLLRYKAMYLRGWELPIATALRLDAGPNPYTSEDRVEGVRALAEKRAPVWRSR
ncbi:enoyl-CoA hydratase/isomerase family protein [Pseudonocardia oroxyli]|uniref:Short chain enoyl-CoA hydratase n=1 Tax=Pseudonocardia oroxyli TaxID=366584 RepID=A0A1G7SP25_PSEOR|nr:enoyl-CoA hydratase/isomerase family protein [Pseudonocardia oroxyli]SDG24652.1 short chain enoyl-CoA hydratase [Pseudonocardia oroxyli]